MKGRYLSKTPFLTFVYISKCNINLPRYFGNSKKRFLWTGLLLIYPSTTTSLLRRDSREWPSRFSAPSLRRGKRVGVGGLWKPGEAGLCGLECRSPSLVCLRSRRICWILWTLDTFSQCKTKTKTKSKSEPSHFPSVLRMEFDEFQFCQKKP